MLGVTVFAEDGVEKKTFLTRDGSQLLLDGRPFRAVGVNKTELIDLYLADLVQDSREEQMAHAHKSLDLLQDIGVDVIRVRATSFWPATIEKTYLNLPDREEFWKRFDEMISDCDKRGIKLVMTIAWTCGMWADFGDESLHEFATNPYSQGRTLLNDWIKELVSRYKDCETILFWEIGNEQNNIMDLHAADGVLKPKKLGPSTTHLVTEPAVRDARNNISADELAAFTRETVNLIKSIDQKHLVSTGFSKPRPQSWNLWMGSLRGTDRPTWKDDTVEQQEIMVRMMTPEVVDLISFHGYLGPGYSFDQVALIKRVGDELGKPVYWGEVGTGSFFEGAIYDHEGARVGFRCITEAIRALDLPIVLFWTWDELGTPQHEPVIRPEDHPEVVEMIRDAQAEAKSIVQPIKKALSEEDKRELKAIAEKFNQACQTAKKEE